MKKSEMKKLMVASIPPPGEVDTFYLDAVKSMGAIDQIRFFDFLRQTIEADEAPLKAKKALLESLKTNTIPQQMEDEGIETVRVEGIGTAYLTTTAKASIQTGQKEAAFEWLRENDLGDLITETANASTLSASFTEAIKEGTPPPVSLFKTFLLTRVNIRKS